MWFNCTTGWVGSKDIHGVIPCCGNGNLDTYALYMYVKQKQTKSITLISRPHTLWMELQTVLKTDGDLQDVGQNFNQRKSKLTP